MYVPTYPVKSCRDSYFRRYLLHILVVLEYVITSVHSYAKSCYDKTNVRVPTDIFFWVVDCQTNSWFYRHTLLSFSETEALKTVYKSAHLRLHCFNG